MCISGNLRLKYSSPQNNGAQQLASEATIFIVLEDVNDEIPLFTEREQETVMEGEPVGTPVTRLVFLTVFAIMMLMLLMVTWLVIFITIVNSWHPYH